MIFQLASRRLSPTHGKPAQGDQLPAGPGVWQGFPCQVGRRFLRGQGAAAKLAEAAAAQLRRRGMKATLTCSYAKKWFGDHPEQGDLLARRED